MNLQNNIIDNEVVKQHAVSRTFTGKVLSYMSAAIAITGVVSYLVGTDMSLLGYIIDFETGKMTILGWVAMLAPLGLVLMMGSGVSRFSATTMLGIFILFSVLIGVSLSTIFLIYSMGSIYLTFFVTSITFGIMATLGYYTQTDLTKFGGILRMALIGIIVAMVVNWFMQSAMMDYLISVIGVLIFTGLTAYDMQKIRKIGMQVETGTESETKLALMGALTLYLDFINLFLFLLRLMGNRN